MSNYEKYYYERQSAYRTLANTCANWIAATHPTKEEVNAVSNVFRTVAKRFGLITEFKELGIM